MGRMMDRFVMHHKDDLRALMEHFGEMSKLNPEVQPYPNFDALMADMLDDVVEVWTDGHLGGNDECKEVL